ncbi:spore coat protein [Aquibacillus kalidii]|uniref:spore coat protein n=1 Tax=Aquibacillus kalidii TaxID=2762597 RepID=UPI0016461F45|nr:spore coat protein [Aquibacillus kalidii]
MQNQHFNQNQGMRQSPNMQAQMNHGGHEILDSHEVLSCMVSLLDQYLIFDQSIRDQELKSIVNRQRSFMTDLYNITVETFSTGRKPSHGTQIYNMQQSNDVTYGLSQSPSQPSRPKTSINEISDKHISGFMLGLVKSTASMLTVASLEATNPVMRRVLADSVPNFIEMAYELFLYQNKNQYYQVPQLSQQDMNQMMQGYAPVQQMQQPNRYQM